MALVVGLKIYGPGGPASSDWPNGQAVPGRPIGDERRRVSGLSLLPGVSGRGRRSATAVGHAGCATGRFKSIGVGQNRTRRARWTYWSRWLGRGSNGNWPATRGGGE